MSKIDIGISESDRNAVAEGLKKLLADSYTLYLQTHNFHWNVEGSDFFDIHEITENLYKESMKNIDIIAERVRLLGGVPNYRLSDYTQNAKISETTHDWSGDNIKLILLEDLETLLKVLTKTAEYSSSHSDFGTVHVMQEMIHGLEMMHYKLQSWIK